MANLHRDGLASTHGSGGSAVAAGIRRPCGTATPPRAAVQRQEALREARRCDRNRWMGAASPAEGASAASGLGDGWCGERPAGMCECTLYAMLWLHMSVQLPELALAAKKVRSLPVARLLRGSTGPGSTRDMKADDNRAMRLLGPVVYALLQPERLLRGCNVEASSWREVNFTPKQLFIYLQAAAFDKGKRGMRLRMGGGRVCRWEDAAVLACWSGLLEDDQLVANMHELLQMPLAEAQANVFSQQKKQLQYEASLLATPVISTSAPVPSSTLSSCVPSSPSNSQVRQALQTDEDLYVENDGRLLALRKTLRRWCSRMRTLRMTRLSFPLAVEMARAIALRRWRSAAQDEQLLSRKLSFAAHYFGMNAAIRAIRTWVLSSQWHRLQAARLSLALDFSCRDALIRAFASWSRELLPANSTSPSHSSLASLSSAPAPHGIHTTSPKRRAASPTLSECLPPTPFVETAASPSAISSPALSDSPKEARKECHHEEPATRSALLDLAWMNAAQLCAQLDAMLLERGEPPELLNGTPLDGSEYAAPASPHQESPRPVEGQKLDAGTVRSLQWMRETQGRLLSQLEQLGARAPGSRSKHDRNEGHNWYRAQPDYKRGKRQCYPKLDRRLNHVREAVVAHIAREDGRRLVIALSHGL
ncbi:hypothetical protein AB1Y20_001444 [Prymnesium parvum]|uniref:Uncharacterized protein n=1 Tax=Prymnesium parvum TaxID=97485 RepID=A0AB34KBB0_PRYPA